MMAKPQIDPKLPPKIHAICAGTKDHVIRMVVIAGGSFQAVDGVDW